MAASPKSTDGKEELKRQLHGLLESSLGLNIYPRLPRLGEVTSRFSLSSGPLVAGMQMAVLYFLFFGTLPWFVFRLSGEVPPSVWPLMVLQIYGAIWSGWATTSTRLASASITGVIERDMIPALSAPAIADISEALHVRYTGGTARWRLFGISWLLGAGAAAIAGILLYRDLPAAFTPDVREIIWWSLGWMLLYTTAAKVVNVSRFYEIFAAVLVRHDRELFQPNPAASSVIAGAALVAKRMLLFWFGIAISIALILPFGLGVVQLIAADVAPGAGIYDLRFVIAHLLGTAFFSIGVGSFIFLRTEARLRDAVQGASAAALRAIEAEARRLQDQGSITAGERKRLAELRALHAEAASGGSYRTFLLSGLSLIIPFVPLITLLLSQLRD